MLFRGRRHRPFIALVALIALLFQQLAMAAYVCPMETGAATIGMAAEQPPCHGHRTDDSARCAEHCNPTAASSVHADALLVPPALASRHTWVSDVDAINVESTGRIDDVVDARTTSPPLTVRNCSFLI